MILARSSSIHVSRNDICRFAFPVAILLCPKYALKCFCHCLNSVIVASLSRVCSLNNAAFQDGSDGASSGSTTIILFWWVSFTSSDCFLFSYCLARSVASIAKSSTCCLKFFTFLLGSGLFVSSASLRANYSHLVQWSISLNTNMAEASTFWWVGAGASMRFLYLLYFSPNFLKSALSVWYCSSAEEFLLNME